MGRKKNSEKLLEATSSLDMSDGSCGLGVDLIDIARFRKILERTPSFESRIFSANEISYCNKMTDKVPHLAVRFAAKEAVLKSLGYGFSDGIGYRDIEVVFSKNNKPEVVLFGVAKEIAEDMGISSIAISLSHTAKDAVCCALAMTKDCAPKKKVEPVDALVSEFKKLRVSL